MADADAPPRVACSLGMTPWHERVEFEFEKETFFLVSFGLVWVFPSYKIWGFAICRFGS